MQLSRMLVRQLRTILRRAGVINPRSANQPVELIRSTAGLSLRGQSAEIAIQYHDPAAGGEDERLLVPVAFLADTEGRKGTVEIVDGGATLTARWTEGVVPRTKTYDPPDTKNLIPWPAAPENWTENSAELLPALHAAYQTADRQSVRFALSCLLLRGGDGAVCATDGRQLLIHAGFSFPWTENVLVPGVNLFGSPELATDAPVAVGTTGEYVALRTGPWTIFLKINRDGRFPELDRHVPKVEAALTRCQIPAGDAAFLAKSLAQLPVEDERHLPVTVDLNGAVAIRARDPDQPIPTELILSQSTWSGEAARINTNRRFLQRAVEQGFETIEFGAPGAPIVCRDPRRTYTWAALSPESAVPPDERALRIESATAVATAPAPIAPVKTRVAKTAVQAEPVRVEPLAAPVAASAAVATQEAPLALAPPAPSPLPFASAPPESQAAPTLIDQVEALRNGLKNLLDQTHGLMKAIKQERRQTRLVRETLATLRGLGTFAA